MASWKHGKSLHISHFWLEVFHSVADRRIYSLFQLAIQENYRNNPFHNFRHCFCVSQMMYGMIHLCNLQVLAHVKGQSLCLCMSRILQLNHLPYIIHKIAALGFVLYTISCNFWWQVVDLLNSQPFYFISRRSWLSQIWGFWWQLQCVTTWTTLVTTTRKALYSACKGC